MADSAEPPRSYIRSSVVRRRSPRWVRLMDRDSLHGLTRRLLNEQFRTGLTRGEDWLLSACISELEYEHRKQARTEGARPCVCDLCRPVDEDLLGDEQPFPTGYAGRSAAIDRADGVGCQPGARQSRK